MLLATVRSDVTYPGDTGGTLHKKARSACVITTVQTDDDVWIPLVTAEGWLIITRDKYIQARKAELAAVKKHGAPTLGPLTWPDALTCFRCTDRTIRAIVSF